MTNDEKAKHWIELAESDILSAEVLAEKKLNLHAGFHCQQAVEKIMKGYFIKHKNEVHPHIHNLIKLAYIADLSDKLSDEQNFFLKELNPLYILTRYDSYKKDVAETLTEERINSLLTRTKEFVSWMKEKMF